MRYSTETANCTDTDTSTPLSSPMDTSSDPTVVETLGQGTHGSSTTTALATAAAELEPHHTVASRPTRVRRRPARFVETVRSRRLPDRNHSASSTRCPLASSDVDALCCRHYSAGVCSEQVTVASAKTVAFVRSCLMSDSQPILRCADEMADKHGYVDSESSDSDVVSWVSDPEDRSVGLPVYAFQTPEGGETTLGGQDVGDSGRVAGGSSSGGPPARAKGAKYTRPTCHFPRQACQLCDEPRVFETRSSFSEHLKIHKYVWVKGTYCIPLQQAMGHMRGRVGPRR